MPIARNHFFAGAVNGKIYAIDGRIGTASVTMLDVIDLSRNREDSLAPRIRPRQDRSFHPSSGGYVGGPVLFQSDGMPGVEVTSASHEVIDLGTQ